MLRIVLDKPLDNKGKELIEKLQKKHIKKVEGINELYTELYMYNSCTSYGADRIYYVAYTLESAGLALKIV